MRAYFFVSPKMLKNVCLFSITILLMNVLSYRYWVHNDLENVSLNNVRGHTVMIDPGHGGIDSGARYNHLLEKDITLALSLKLGAILTENGANVFYTRTTDVDYYTKGKGGKRNDLLKRIDMINSSAAELFVSIHCNAVRGSQWFGSQVFYNPKDKSNERLARDMQTLLRKFPPNNRRDIKTDQKILILSETKIPGVLVEAGYLSNHKEAKLLADENYQYQLALQLAKAIAGYFQTGVH